ncbi:MULTISPECIES: EF-hand domain-containing protein [Glycomyces]|uniref:Ca2+-binding EF-hand superfamily protein n=2 Tax=Glycomyces TaxID=58113 RepID=A0A9X3TA37_9ACTN|nr:EF-hand domain-containing protein [Glycomyces lechevalierae]MDA1387238.1 EF-hand domain-containing protein [Glycomyces lechevalierae]MDR7338498.1 Ca2+-binding EF-hand superfamily protein [Glycomyces lechevalierae]
MSQNDYRAKMRTRFATFDIDGDGEVTAADFEAMARRVIEEFEVREGSPEASAILEGAHRFFVGLAEATDTDGSGSISEREFLEGAEQRLLDNPEGFDAIARPWVQSVIAIADVDRDGHVSVEEWARALQAMGPNERVAEKDLQSVDRDRDGRVTLEEATAAVAEYYTSARSLDLFANA